MFQVVKCNRITSVWSFRISPMVIPLLLLTKSCIKSLWSDDGISSKCMSHIWITASNFLIGQFFYARKIRSTIEANFLNIFWLLNLLLHFKTHLTQHDVNITFHFWIQNINHVYRLICFSLYVNLRWWIWHLRNC